MTRSTRRQFLTSAIAGSSVLTFGSAVPGFLRQAAAASKKDGRILVVVEMAGGNDGLSSIVPYADEAYQKARPKLAVARGDVLAVEDGLGLHPALRGFADLLEQGHFAAVQGVGYPEPNRSHFESMDIWHTCHRKDRQRVDGWLGRYLEAAELGRGNDPAALHLGADKQPLALMSRDVRVASVQSLEQFRLSGDESGFKTAVRDLAAVDRAAGEDLLGFVQASTTSAITASERMESAGVKYQPSTAYPKSQLGGKLETVAKLIAAGLDTKVYYVQLDGFDTHAQQSAAHAALLRELGDAVSTFVKDMVAHGEGDRVLVMCFSEFGRRVAENASEGTDHGTAGPIFLAGTRLQTGLIGKHPRLDDLDQGDLKHHTDFRQVYATVLEQWLACPSDKVLGRQYEPVGLFQSLS